jgi:hopanoid biosynthesis associated radical SAM protein HpnH
MIFPWQLSLSLAGYMVRNRLKGRTQYPMVLMLEPTFKCNLACAGCGRVREDQAVGSRMLTLDECIQAVEDTDAPVVSIAGGEPLLHPQIGEIVDAIVARKHFVHLCTNGLLLRDALGESLRPSPYLCIVFHIDGLASTHDGIAGRKGVFESVLSGIESAIAAGFQVRTNTTVYRGTDRVELLELFGLLCKLGVSGMMVAPAFSYEEVSDRIFLTRQETAALFSPIWEQRARFRFYNTPTYLEFLAGKRLLECVPWSTPTRNPKGWRKPCYLLTDGYCDGFQKLMAETTWDSYGPGRDPRCANCMVHSGFEAGALEATGRSIPAIWRMAKWSLTG